MPFVDPFESGATPSAKPEFRDPFQAPANLDFVDRTKKTEEPSIEPSRIAGAGLMGAVTGFATPEISAGLGKVLSAVPYPPVKMAGEALQAAAPFMGLGERAAGAVTGGIAGLGGESAKQFAENIGIDPRYANLIGFGVESLSPAIVSTMPKILTKIPGFKTAGDLITLVAEKAGRNPKSFTDAEKKFIALEADKMRGSQPGAGPLFQELQAGTQQIEAQAAAAATSRQTKAEKEALTKLVESGKQPTLADRITTKAQSNVYNVGNPDSDLTTLGNTHRKAISDRFSEENLARDAEYKAKKAERDAIVSEKENSGQFIKDLPSYKTLFDKLRKNLLIGRESLQQTTAPVTDQETINSYQRVYDALTGRKIMVSAEDAEALKAQGVPVVPGTNPLTGEPAMYRQFPTSFDALDHVRRKLGDVAFGVEQEGYKALGQKIAENLYGDISQIQRDFAGEVQDELQSGYEITSGLLERYKGGPGAAVLKTEKMAPEMFSMEAKDIPNRFFSNKEGPTNLASLTKDPAMVEKTASDYVALNLKDKSAQEAENWIKRQEFLKAPEMANLRPKIDSYVKGLRAAETRASGVVSTGKAQEAQAQEIIQAGLREAKGITDEAKGRVSLILGDKDPEARVAEILSSKSKKLWDEVSTILNASPKGKDLLDRSVAQHLANLAVKTERGAAAVDALNDLREPLVTRGLLTQQRFDSLMSQLQRMRTPEKQKLSWLANQFLRGGTSVTGAQIGSFLGGLTPSMFGGQ